MMEPENSILSIILTALCIPFGLLLLSKCVSKQSMRKQNRNTTIKHSFHFAQMMAMLFVIQLMLMIVFFCSALGDIQIYLLPILLIAIVSIYKNLSTKTFVI